MHVARFRSEAALFAKHADVLERHFDESSPGLCLGFLLEEVLALCERVKAGSEENERDERIRHGFKRSAFAEGLASDRLRRLCNTAESCRLCAIGAYEFPAVRIFRNRVDDVPYRCV